MTIICRLIVVFANRPRYLFRKKAPKRHTAHMTSARRAKASYSRSWCAHKLCRLSYVKLQSCMVSAQQHHTCQQTQAWRRDQDPIIRSPLFLFSLAGDLAETIGQRAALCQRARGGSQPTQQSDGIRLVDSSAAQQVRLRAIC